TIVEFKNCAQVNDAGHAEGQPQKKRYAVPRAVISHQYAGGDRKAEQRRDNFSARPGQRIQLDVELPKEMPQNDSSAAGDYRQGAGTADGPQTLEFLEYCH